MKKTYDVVIVGGGITGSSVAYFLAAAEVFDGDVVVVEKDSSYQDCSTARAVGGIRQQFSTKENIQISMFGIHFIKHIEEYLTVDGEAPEVFFREGGYLFLATESGLEVLQRNNAIQRELGADIVLLSRDELAARFPWLNVSDLAAGSLGLRNEGWFDPYALLQGFKRKARSLGVTYVEDEVQDVECEDARITRVRLKRHGTVRCGTVVNAAGPRAAQLAEMAGVDLCVRPRKRQAFVFACREAVRDCPLVIEPSGLYFRPEGPHFICGRSPQASNDPDCLDLDLDYRQFEDELWPLLAHRVPVFEAIKLNSGWAGHYAYNIFDQNAIVGPHPEVPNFLLANGFTGHGLQQSPAVGRAISELVTFGRCCTIDLTRFGYDRVAAGEPIKELNVV